MAAEVRKFSVTVAAGTPLNAPSLTSMNFPPRIVREIHINVPPGPRGNLGFQIAQAGAQIFPTEPGAFFVTDDEKIIWPVEGANTSGAWQLRAYNTGTFPHTVEIRFMVDLPGAGAAEDAPEAVDPASLGPSAVTEPTPSFPPPPGVGPLPIPTEAPPEGQSGAPEVPPAELVQPTTLGLPAVPPAPNLPAANLPPDAQGQGGTLPPAASASPTPNPSGVGLTAGPPTPTTEPLDTVPNPTEGFTAGTPTPTTPPTDSGTRLFI